MGTSLVFREHVSGRATRRGSLLLDLSMSGESLNVRPGKAEGRTAKMSGHKSMIRT
jgi:hypothetical protein